MFRPHLPKTVVALLFASAASAETTIHVDDDAALGGDGTSWNTAFRHLQDALAGAASGDEIRVAQGTYPPDQDEADNVTPGDREATFQLRNGVALRGGYAGPGAADPDARDIDAYETILSGDLAGDDTPVACTQNTPDCDDFGGLCAGDGFCSIADNNDENSYHVVTGSGIDDTAILDGFTITAGNANGGSYSNSAGGGMFNDTASPRVTNCTFRGNVATGDVGGGGGGMFNSYSSPAVTNCTFRGNWTHERGGGMFNGLSDPAVTNCVFSGNSASIRLGGLKGSGVFFVIAAPLSRGRRLPTAYPFDPLSVPGIYGGGMYNVLSNPSVTNCTFSGNSSVGLGGGMYNWNNSNPTIANCTFSGNSASILGGGIYSSSSGDPTLYNVILSGNSPEEIVGQSAFVNYSIVQGGWTGAGGTGVIDADPLFVDPDGPDGIPGTEDDDLRLLPGSPAIDAGGNAGVPPDVADLDGDGDTTEQTPLDLDGNPRFVDDPETADTGNGTPPVVDIGAYELFHAIACENDADCDDALFCNGAEACDPGNPDADQNGCVAGVSPCPGQLCIEVNDECVDLAPVLYVDDDAPPGGDGIGWATALNHLQDALSAAQGGGVDEIRVAAGTYLPDQGTGNIPGSRWATFQLLNNVALRGGYAGIGAPDPDARDIDTYQTVLSGDLAGDDGFGVIAENSYHVVTGTGTGDTAILDGFTIKGGNANGAGADNQLGGGMYNNAGSPTVADCTFSGNSANGSGGGMYNSDSSNPAVTNSTFIGNSADRGGGMYNFFSSPVVTDCTFSGNSADLGGGMSNTSNSSPTVTDCMFSGNSAIASFGGGGMSNLSNSNPEVTNCTFSGNSAITHHGGGMYNVSNSSPTVTDCTFGGNSANTNGGGMYNLSNSSPAVTDCIFTGNSANHGGGIANSTNSNPTVTNCTFGENSANSNGGGMSGGSAAVTNCTFSGNSADQGGGMSGGSAAVTNCTFSGNSANYGGGMRIISSSPTLTNCTFSGNSANSSGGGISNAGSGSPTVTICTFSGNSANNRGGGMYTNGGSPTVTNCTFSGNSAGDGGGIYNNNGASPAVTNCILWHNSPSQMESESGTGIVNYSIVQGGWTGAGGTDVIDADPLFVDPDGPDGIPGTEDDDLRLRPGSPAIDAGDNEAVPPDAADLDGDGDTSEPIPLDLDGNPRFVDDPETADTGNGSPPIVDMGAYEFQGLDCNVDAVGTVDLSDYALLVDCIAEGGPGQPTPPGCGGADLDLNGRVDFQDFGAFQRCFPDNGP